MTVQPFLLACASDLLACRERGQSAIGTWESDWACLTGMTLDCRAAYETGRDPVPVGATWRARTLANGECVWVSASDELAVALARRLAGSTARGGGVHQQPAVIADAVSEQLAQALLSSVVAALSGQASQDSAGPCLDASSQFRPGSGAVLATLELDGTLLQVLLPSTVARRPKPARAKARAVQLTGVAAAAASLPVTVRVEVGALELTLGHLRTLAIGDVITLPARLDQPLRVVAPGDLTVCRAHIGTRDQARAIEIAAVSI